MITGNIPDSGDTWKNENHGGLGLKHLLKTDLCAKSGKHLLIGGTVLRTSSLRNIGNMTETCSCCDDEHIPVCYVLI